MSRAGDVGSGGAGAKGRRRGTTGGPGDRRADGPSSRGDTGTGNTGRADRGGASRRGGDTSRGGRSAASTGSGAGGRGGASRQRASASPDGRGGYRGDRSDGTGTGRTGGRGRATGGGASRGGGRSGDRFGDNPGALGGASGAPGRGAPPRPRDRSRNREAPGAETPLRPPERRRGRPDTTELGGEQIEGRHAVRELLAARRRPVRQVWMADGLEPSPILDEIEALADAASVPVRTVNSARLRSAAATDAPQGVVAFAAPLPEADLDDLVTAPPGEPAPFLVVVDGVTDPHNLGALLRTAQCAGATGAVLPRHRSAHLTATVAKAAAGAIEYLQIAVVPGIPSALARLAEAGVWTVGLDVGAPNPLWSLSVATEAIAIVLGAEGSGLSRLAKARCQLLVAIPQAGPITSLNVAAAGALACFEVSRARLMSARSGVE